MDRAKLQKIIAILESIKKPAIRLRIGKSITLDPQSYFKSHFGGLPYFEVGNTWPMTKDGKPLDFIFQVYNQNIRLIVKRLAKIGCG